MEEEKGIISLCLAARQHLISQLSDMTNDPRWFISKDGLRWNDVDVYLARFGFQPRSDSVLSVHCTATRKWVSYDRGSLMKIFMDLEHWSKTFYPYITAVTVRELNLLNPFVEGLCSVIVKFCVPSPNFVSMEYQFYRFKSYMKADLSSVIDVGGHFLHSDPFSEMFLRHPSALFVRDRETRKTCSMSEVIWIESMQFPNSANSSVLELSFKASRWVDTLISYQKRSHSSFHLCVDSLGDSYKLRYACIDLLDGMRNAFNSYLNIIAFDVWEVLVSETFCIYHRIGGFANKDYLAIQTVSVPLCDSIVFQTLRKWTLESWSLCTDDQIMEFGAYDRSHSLALYKNLESSRYYFLVAETDGFFHALSFDFCSDWEMKRFVRCRKLPLLRPAGFLIIPLNEISCEVTIIVRRQVLDGEVVEVMTDDLRSVIERLVEFGNNLEEEIPSSLEACRDEKWLSRQISKFGQDSCVWLRLADSVKGSFLNLLRSCDIVGSGWHWVVDSTPDVRVVFCGNKSVATTTFFVDSKHDVVYDFLVGKTVQFQWPFSYYFSSVEKSFRSEDRYNSIVLHRNCVSPQGDQFLLQESYRNDSFSYVISCPLVKDDVIGAFSGSVSRTDFGPSGFVLKPVSSNSSKVTLLVSRVLSDYFVGDRSKILCDIVNRIIEECCQSLGMSSQAVGWPTVGVCRMNGLVKQAKSPATVELNSISQITKSKNTVLEKSNNGIEKNFGNAKENGHLRTSLFVKVNMDGNSIGRKVDLSVHYCYENLAQMLEELFCKPPAVKAIRLNGEERNTMVEARRPSKLLDVSSEFVLTYQDKDGDLMLVGDVPWEMFMCSVKRLRIMRSFHAKGLAPLFREMSGIRRSKSI